MKVIFAAVGRTRESYVKSGMAEYAGRISRYLPFEMRELPEAKGSGKSGPEQQLLQESQPIMQLADGKTTLVLLDEGGREFNSVEFAGFVRDRMADGTRTMVFVSGGAYGFHPFVHAAARYKISLSRMTFPHQLVRLIFLEQLYRALTIIRGEPYHHA